MRETTEIDTELIVNSAALNVGRRYRIMIHVASGSWYLLEHFQDAPLTVRFTPPAPQQGEWVDTKFTILETNNPHFQPGTDRWSIPRLLRKGEPFKMRTPKGEGWRESRSSEIIRLEVRYALWLYPTCGGKRQISSDLGN